MSQHFDESQHVRDPKGQFADKGPAAEDASVDLSPDSPDEGLAEVHRMDREMARALESDDDERVGDASAAFVAAAIRRRFPEAAYAELETDEETGIESVSAIYDADRDEIDGSDEYLEYPGPDWDSYDEAMQVTAGSVGYSDAVEAWPRQHGKQYDRVINLDRALAKFPAPGTAEHLAAAMARQDRRREAVEKAQVQLERDRTRTAMAVVRLVSPQARSVELRPMTGGRMRVATMVRADGSRRDLREDPDLVLDSRGLPDPYRTSYDLDELD